MHPLLLFGALLLVGRAQVFSEWTTDSSANSPPVVNETIPLRVALSGNIGYRFASLSEVNAYLEKIASEFRSAGAIANRIQKETLDGGFAIDGAVTLRLKRFLFGAAISSLGSVEGKLSYADPSGSLAESFSMSAFDIVPFIGIRTFGSQSFVFDMIAGIGYGSATADYQGELRITATPSRNVTIEFPLSGNYLAGRLEGIATLIANRVRINFAAGYRFANAGVIKGKQTFNGQTTEGEFPFRYDGKDIEFDFSGFVLRGGVGVEF